MCESGFRQHGGSEYGVGGRETSADDQGGGEGGAEDGPDEEGGYEPGEGHDRAQHYGYACGMA